MIVHNQCIAKEARDNMDKINLLHATQELIRDLCILADKGVVISKDKFHAVCEKDQFVEFVLLEYGQSIRLDYFQKSSEIRKQDTIDYINDAFGRHTNAYVMEDYGLHNNAIFFAINVAVKILDEIQDMQKQRSAA